MTDSNVTEVEIRKTTPKELDEHTEWYFVGKAANGEIVATSETYTTKADALRGANAVFPHLEGFSKNEKEA